MEFTAPDRAKPLFRDNPILASFPARDIVTEDSLRGVLHDMAERILGDAP
jgi:hypothetical protein